MLTKEQCVVGAYVVGVFDLDCWYGQINSVLGTGWTADLYRYPAKEPNYVSKSYWLGFKAYAMEANFSLSSKKMYMLASKQKKPKSFKSWTLKCSK